MAEQTGSSPMFAIFVLSLLSLALIPYTIYHFTGQGDAEDVVKPWQVSSSVAYMACLCSLALVLRVVGARSCDQHKGAPVPAYTLSVLYDVLSNASLQYLKVHELRLMHGRSQVNLLACAELDCTHVLTLAGQRQAQGFRC